MHQACIHSVTHSFSQKTFIERQCIRDRGYKEIRTVITEQKARGLSDVKALDFFFVLWKLWTITYLMRWMTHRDDCPLSWHPCVLQELLASPARQEITLLHVLDPLVTVDSLINCGSSTFENNLRSCKESWFYSARGI